MIFPNQANTKLVSMSLHVVVWKLIPHCHHRVVISLVVTTSTCHFLNNLGSELVWEDGGLRLAERAFTILVAALRHESLPCDKFI